MAQRHTLAASERTLKGKEVKRLRREGQTPGIIYGPVIPEPISITLDARELERMYYGYGSNLLVDVQLDGQTYVVYMRNVTMDRIKRAPQHAEFYAPNLRNPIVANVPILLVGESPNDRAVVTPGHATLEIRGLPEQLPSGFEVDISGLTEFDDALYVRDIAVPDGIELLTDPEEMVVKLSAPALITEAEEEAEAEAAEEGAEAEAAAEAGEPAAEAESDEG
jgi:large subunit ribosomal protein L25